MRGAQQVHSEAGSKTGWPDTHWAREVPFLFDSSVLRIFLSAPAPLEAHSPLKLAFAEVARQSLKPAGVVSLVPYTEPR